MSRLAFWPKRTIAFTVVFRYTQVATLPLRRLEYSSYDAELPVAYGEEKVVVRTWLASFALLLTFGIAAHAWGDTLADEMAALNARWDAAINDPNPDALVPMYTADARLMPPGAQPVIGPAAIRNFFAARGTSTRNHKLQLVDILPIGNYAYVTSHFTASFVKDGVTTPISGSTVRMCERQSDGQWRIRSHMFVRE